MAEFEKQPTTFDSLFVTLHLSLNVHSIDQSLPALLSVDFTYCHLFRIYFMSILREEQFFGKRNGHLYGYQTQYRYVERVRVRSSDDKYSFIYHSLCSNPAQDT